MKLIALLLALTILPLQKSFTGSPDASTNAPQYTQGTTRYFNMTPGGQQGNLVVVKENGLPGIWNNSASKWLVTPGGFREVFFATSNQLYYTDLEGRVGFGQLQPGFEESGPYDSKDFSCPFAEAAYYPSRNKVQYICLRMDGAWTVVGADGFLSSAMGSSPKDAVAFMQEANRKPENESNAVYVMRQFRELVSPYLHSRAEAKDPDAPGLFISILETPYAGPYFLSDVPAGCSATPEYGILGVKNGVLTLVCGEFYCPDNDNSYWYEDYSAEPPYIPLNAVTYDAARFDAIPGTDGGVFFGTKEDGGYGIHLRPDGSYKFGETFLHFRDDGTYTPFGHSDWWEDDWKIPAEMDFREFFFAYEFQAYNSDPDYDEDAIWEKAKKIYLKANPAYLFSERDPMIPEGYDSERQAMKMVISRNACPSFFIPMNAQDAEKLLRDYKKYGPDELIWWYSRGIDNEGYDYVTEARIGWPLNWPGLKKEKYFEYKAE